ncbi:SDR family NAD(P)-dependent oxidoreductase [Paenibacillus sp. 276b]|uniref:SDR family NAD(P)-dependent oxidoreductase n=1 Tax=Paenibacillus sp. 276b TaxID=1566277 RepID=UPI00210A9A82|nr:SDR family NAD(P)-dependent oxidoreductase [Paenibacillus sp. 276b]
MKNKVVIVTGAGTGLGKAVAIKLAEEGAQVVLVGRRKEKLQDVAQIIKNSGGQSLIIPADITDQDDVQRLRDQVLEQTGRIDVLINNAQGVQVRTSPFMI